MKILPAAVALLALGAVPAAAQTPEAVAARVAAVGTGRVTLGYDARDGVCGGHGWRTVGGRRARDGGECSGYRIRAELRVREGRLVAVDDDVEEPEWRSAAPSHQPGHVELGDVAPDDAARALLILARQATDHAAADAMDAAALADSGPIWQELADAAREAPPRSDRGERAMFWLAVRAGERVAPDDHGDRTDDQEVRDAAVFALSQRDPGESVPELLQVARENHDPHTRRMALFWLGQAHDRRALALFEEILGGG